MDMVALEYLESSGDIARFFINNLKEWSLRFENKGTPLALEDLQGCDRETCIHMLSFFESARSGTSKITIYAGTYLKRDGHLPGLHHLVRIDLFLS